MRDLAFTNKNNAREQIYRAGGAKAMLARSRAHLFIGRSISVSEEERTPAGSSGR
jgi:hypothetical protein